MPKNGRWTTVQTLKTELPGCLAFSVLLSVVSIGYLRSGCDLLCMTRHGEAISLVTFGKFQSGFFPVDGFSGDAYVYYNPLSGLLLNWIATALDVPVLHVAFLAGQAILPALFLSLYLSLRALNISPKSAAFSSIVATLLSDAFAFHIAQALPISGEFSVRISLQRLLFHTPLNSSAIATANSFAYPLVPPSIAFFVRFLQKGRAGDLFLFASVAAALMLCHSLTGMALLFAAAFAQAGYMAMSIPKASAVGFILLFFVASAAVASNSTYILTLSGLVVAFGASRSVGLGKALAALVPLVLSAAYIFASIWKAEFFGSGLTFSAHQGIFLPWLLALLLPLLLLLWTPFKIERLSMVLMCLGVFALAEGEYWGMHNHPYRFATYLGLFLAFPIASSLDSAILAMPQKIGIAVCSAATLLNLGDLALETERSLIAGRQMNHVYGEPYNKLSSDERELLLQVKALTSDRKSRFLNFAPLHYPLDAIRNSIVMSYAKTPGLIPDLRYTGKTHNIEWLLLYCAIFDVQAIGTVGYETPYKHIEEIEDVFKTCIPAEDIRIPSDTDVYLLVGRGNLAGSANESHFRPGIASSLTPEFENAAGTIYRLASE